jgi:phosphoribosylanthranilate isomerase
MLIQIYEANSAEEAEALSALGVDHVGVLVGEGAYPRERAPEEALRIASGICAPARLSALFLSADMDYVARHARALSAPIVHLGALEREVSPAMLRALKRALPEALLMRSLAVTGPESIEVAARYEGIADFLLLDTERGAQLGALGLTHDWSISREIVRRVKVPAILAGGLGPDNVEAAIKAVRPAGVDSKTKTDIEGTHKKDLEKVRLFVEAARRA